MFTLMYKQLVVLIYIYIYIYHVKAFDSIDLKLFMNFGKAFDCVVIMEKPLTVLIFWFILKLLMC